jgi:hypothetical protein
VTATRTAQDQRLRDLQRGGGSRTADREYAQPADVDALARGVNMSSQAQFDVSVRGSDLECRRSDAYLARPLLA